MSDRNVLGRMMSGETLRGSSLPFGKLANAKLVLRVALLLPALWGCETFGGGGGSSTGTGTGGDGPLTTCIYNYSNGDSTKKAFGEPCTSDDECAFAECLMPGDTGNESNAVFGFCTRGCDCDNAVESRLTETEKQSYVCLYPAGNQGKDRHVVKRCSAVSDCTSVGSQYDECTIPSNGGVFKICRAGIE